MNVAYQQQRSGDLRQKQLFVVIGCAFVLAALVLVSKVLDQVYLNARFNIHVALGGLILSFAMFLFGGWILFSVCVV